jgi:glutamyl/glutaminyl-tRNA synthetase
MYATRKTTIKSRYAPTPSGLLHKGNGYNLLLTYLITKSRNGQLHLRIDDYDLIRTKDAYILDIFETLEWLHLEWDTGPKNLTDFQKYYSSKYRYKNYQTYLDKFPNKFVCECSRKDLKKYPEKYPGTCYQKNLIYIQNENAVKIKGSKKINDFIIWTRENLPSYQLASLIDDLSLGVNLIIRGEDLAESTKFQKYLASELNLSEFLNTTFIHHKLATDWDGQKYSKSDGSQSLKSLRNNGMTAEKFYKEFCIFMKLNVGNDYSLSNMLNAVKLLSW